MNDSDKILNERSPLKGDLFFHFPIQSIWSKTEKKIYKNQWGTIAYEQVGRSFVVAGDPLSKSLDAQVACMDDFIHFVKTKNGRVCGYYFSEEFAQKSSLEHHCAGVSRLNDLKNWSMKGHRSEEFRRARRKGEASNLEVKELKIEDLENWQPALLNFANTWRKQKGIIRIGFLLSPLSKTLDEMLKGERLFICHKNQSIHAIISFKKWSYKNYYIDQLMQRRGGHRYALDYLLTRSFQTLQQEGVSLVSLGFCPGIVKRPATWVELILSLWSRTRIFYSPQGLYTFKRKYSNIEKNRYLLLDPKASKILQIFDMERATLSLGAVEN
ncbi:MAG: DUF2156 domain-containing protein [Bdellovibrionales bacterium]|nr:DUF2156 domain-containing protein [Bdellovibrionales bacterium]